jgi:hypothetical protein
METEKILNKLIEKYGIADEDVAKLEEAMQKDGLFEGAETEVAETEEPATIED